MAQHEQITCPRCGVLIECCVGSINLCQCQLIRLTEEQRRYIGSLYEGCLCHSCLATLRTEYNVQMHQQELNRFLSSR